MNPSDLIIARVLEQWQDAIYRTNCMECSSPLLDDERHRGRCFTCYEQLLAKHAFDKNHDRHGLHCLICSEIEERKREAACP